MPTEEIQVSGADLEEQAASAASAALERAQDSMAYEDAQTAKCLSEAWAEIRTINVRTKSLGA